MSFSVGPAYNSIVFNGLTFLMDANNNSGFPYPSSTVYNAIDLTTSGSLGSGITWNTTNRYFNYTGNGFISLNKNATGLGMYDASYTAEAWVYPSQSLVGDRGIFGDGGASIRQGLHLMFRDGTIYQGHFGSPPLYDFQAGTVALDNWYQIVYTYNVSNGACQIYKNAVLQGSGTIQSYIGTTNINLGVGYGGIGFFIGYQAIYRLYNRVLTQAEITQNFNANRGRFGI
jgi:hypothetical protein